MEMIVMDEHNTRMQATVRMDKLKQFQHHLKEGNALTIQRYSLGKMCIQNGYWGTKLYLFDGNKAIYEDEYKEVEEFIQRFRLQILVQDETGIMSLSLFNDEVQAMVGRSAYQLCEKYAKAKNGAVCRGVMGKSWVWVYNGDG
nr:replication protein A 70 kDa DNA-binding subunit B [Tanacetum cinerariifolium]